jgi:hypothetical protein
MTQINLKENLRNSLYWAHFTLLKNSMDGLQLEISMLFNFNNSLQQFIYVILSHQHQAL